jgi:hypothetical protein
MKLSAATVPLSHFMLYPEAPHMPHPDSHDNNSHDYIRAKCLSGQ